MPSALVTMSHSPLMGFTKPAGQARERVEAAFDDARAFISDFAPELVVIFGPDHYNGFFYDMMPSFCVGAAAESIGDYDTPAGPLTVDHDAALALIRAVLDAEVDVTLSERMYVDHGFAQPLQVLLGGIDTVPVVPVFINCVAVPLGPARRARLLGHAMGKAAAEFGRRVLFIGSGGLSHDPRYPRWKARRRRSSPSSSPRAGISARSSARRARCASSRPAATTRRASPRFSRSTPNGTGTC